MTRIALELQPLDSAWEECPARGHLCDRVDWAALRPFDLAWPEHWVEAFLAEHPAAIPACLGGNPSGITVWRQLADIDLVYLETATDTAILVELKKQAGSHAKDAVCQLARNLNKAKRILRRHGTSSVRAVACGPWRKGQIANATNTVAWQYLEEEGASPTFALYSGAISPSGSRFLVINQGEFPFPGKGKRLSDPVFDDLRGFTQHLNSRLPKGLALGLYRLGSSVILRFMADSPLRDSYLSAKIGQPHSRTLSAFFVGQKLLATRGLAPALVIGQRLELRAEIPLPENPQSDYSTLRGTLSDLVSRVTEAEGPPA